MLPISNGKVGFWEVSHSRASRADETGDKARWRREESEYSGVLKTRNLLILRDAKNAENGKIAPNWNVSGTWDFDLFIRREKKRSSAPARIRTLDPLP
jgi:hypothetical protein